MKNFLLTLLLLGAISPALAQHNDPHAPSPPALTNASTDTLLEIEETPTTRLIPYGDGHLLMKGKQFKLSYPVPHDASRGLLMGYLSNANVEILLLREQVKHLKQQLKVLKHKSP